ncbi:hypothetical protein ACHZ98_20570 [Streptomyces sp. MAR4 CNY-716]
MPKGPGTRGSLRLTALAAARAAAVVLPPLETPVAELAAALSCSPVLTAPYAASEPPLRPCARE